MHETLYTNRKEHIRKVAQQLFRLNGYPATSMRQLASEVGIEAASIYSHIKSKEEILKDICFGMADEFMEAIEQVQSQQLDVEGRLRKAIESHISVITNNMDAAAVFFHDWRHLSGEAMQSFKQLRHTYESIFRSIIKAGVETGVFRLADEKFVVLTIFSAMNWTYEWYKPESGMTGSMIAENLSDIIINGIKNK